MGRDKGIFRMPKSHKVIVVSGTPGTGKTFIAKRLAKQLNYKYIDVNKVIKSYNLIVGYDRQRKCFIVDVDKLTKALTEIIKSMSGVIIDSHLSHYLNPSYVDLCIITKCDLKELKRRLEKRGYSEEKVRENLDAEIFDICFIEAKELGHNILVIDTTKSINIKNISKRIKDEYL